MDVLCQAASDIVTILQHTPSTTVPSLQAGNNIQNVLLQLETILNQVDELLDPIFNSIPILQPPPMVSQTSVLQSPPRVVQPIAEKKLTQQSTINKPSLPNEKDRCKIHPVQIHRYNLRSARTKIQKKGLFIITNK